MKKILLFAAVSLFLSSSVKAQFMPSTEGQVLTFESKDMKESKSETYTATVTSVEESKENGTITVGVTERHAMEGTLFGEMEHNVTYIYTPETGVTVNIIMTSEEFKRLSMMSIREMFSQAGQYVSDQQMAELEKAFKPKGELSIALPAEAEDGASFANSSIRCSLMGQSAGMKIVKGTYGGFEEVEVPAGKFNCLKVMYTLSIIGESGDQKITTWYAPGVGKVKEISTDKKGNPIAEEVLVKIS